VAKNAVLIKLLSEFDGKDLARAQREIATMQKKTQTFSQKFQTMGRNIQKFGDGVARTGGSLTKGLTLPIVGLGAVALKTAGDFEKSMNKVRAVSGATGEDFEHLETMAKELGRTTAFTAGEAADGMSFLAMAGFKVNDILGSMPGVLDLAAAGQMDLAEAADISSNILTGFGRTADQMDETVDILTKTFTSSNTSLSQLGEGMKFVAPIAASAGMSFTDTAAAMGLLGDAGIQGSMAGTTLRNIISRLLSPSSKAEKTMQKLGLATEDGGSAFLDAEGNLKSFADITEMLAGSGAKTADIMQIFGARAGPGMSALISQGSDKLANLTQMLEESGGTAAFVADTQLEGLNGSLTKLRSAFEGLMIALADSGLLDKAADLVTQLTAVVGKLTQGFQSLDPDLQKVILKVAGIAAAIGPVLLVVGKLIAMIGGLIAVFNPVTLKIAAVVAIAAVLAAGFMHLWNSSETLRNTVMQVFEEIKATVSQAIEAVQQALHDNRDAIETVKTAIQAFAQVIADKVVPVIVKFYAFYLSNVIKVLGFLAVKFIEGMANFVKGVSVLVEVGQRFVEFARTIKDNIEKGIDVIAAVPDQIKDLFKAAPKLLVQAGKDIVRGLMDGAGSLLPKLGQFFLDELPSFMVEPFKRALGIESPSKLFAGFGKDIISGLQGALEAGGPEIAQAMRDSVVEAIKSRGAELKEALDEQKQIFSSFAHDVSQTIMGGISFADALPQVDEDGNRVGMSFIDGLNAQAERAVEFANKIQFLLANKLSREALQQVLSRGTEAGIAIADELIAGGAGTIETTNELVRTTQKAADDVGLLAADNFHSAGVESALQTYTGFRDNFGKGGPARKALMGLMDNIAAAAARDVNINVNITRRINEIISRFTQNTMAAGAEGAIVRRPTFALIGEAGPEAVVPLNRTRGNAPLPSMSGGNVNINVNAGIGTDGRAVGRQIVEALKQYERQNGPLPVRVA
tara:strand:+ start:1658 stop:4567 length:2910 start_codon:yes stop_codon:yes gene_type:complete